MDEHNEKRSLAENLRSIRQDFHDELEDHLACLQEEPIDSTTDTSATDTASRFGNPKQIELFLWFYHFRSLLMSNFGKIALATVGGCIFAVVAWSALDASIQNRRLVAALSERLDDLNVHSSDNSSSSEPLQAGVSRGSLIMAEQVVEAALKDLEDRLKELAEEAYAFKASNPELVYRNDKLHDPYAESYAQLSERILGLEHRKTEIDTITKHIKASQNSGSSTASLLLALQHCVDGLELEDLDSDMLDLKLKEVISGLEEESKIIDAQITNFELRLSDETERSREVQSAGIHYEQLLIRRRALPQLITAYTDKLQEIDLLARENAKRNGP